jgi:tungstate transport system ATP-binding protein
MNGRLLHVAILKKRYGARVLLDMADFSLDAGKIYVLTGDNGSGKSTLLRILAGLEPGDALDMEFDGRALNGSGYPAQWRRDIIYVHQHPYLFNTTVAKNIAYGLKVRGNHAGKRDEIVRAAMDWAGVAQVADVPPRKLSGGEKQKVALARAKVLNPRVFLVDEPTANLDRAAREQIVGLLEQTASANNCVLVVCHDREIIDLPHVVRLHLEDGKVNPA